MTETLISLIDEACVTYADKPCLIFDDQSTSFVGVHGQSCAVANFMGAAGFQPGMLAAVFSPNHPSALISTLGIIRAGGIWVPVNPRNSMSDNLALLKAFGCDAIFYHSSFAEAAAVIGKQHPGLKFSLCIDRDFHDLVAQYPASPHKHEPRPEDIVMIPMTGGTTGIPKAVALSNRNWVAMLKGVKAESDGHIPVNLAAAPMTHVGGRIILTVMYRGGVTVVLQQAHPALILAAIEKHRVTDLFLPPTAIYNLIEHSAIYSTDLSSLRSVFYGSAPISISQLKNALATLGPVMVGGFGQTEAPLLISRLHAADHFIDGKIAPDSRLRSVGRATKASRLAIMADDGALLPLGQSGEIVVRGDFVCEGYFRNPQATAEIRRDGWHLTGDIGYLDDDGFLYIVDRKKDMIITGGFNVYSSEVEGVISAMPGVRECIVIGTPDERWGEAVTAIVRLDKDVVLAADRIQAVCKDQLGSVKAPKRVEFVDEFPRNANSKIMKKQIRDSYWQL